MVIFGHIISQIVWCDHDVSDDLSIAAAVPQPALLSRHDDKPPKAKITRVGELASDYHDASAATTHLATALTKSYSSPGTKISWIIWYFHCRRAIPVR